MDLRNINISHNTHKYLPKPHTKAMIKVICISVTIHKDLSIQIYTGSMECQEGQNS